MGRKGGEGRGEGEREGRWAGRGEGKGRGQEEGKGEAWVGRVPSGKSEARRWLCVCVL